MVVDQSTGDWDEKITTQIACCRLPPVANWIIGKTGSHARVKCYLFQNYERVILDNICCAVCCTDSFLA